MMCSPQKDNYHVFNTSFLKQHCKGRNHCNTDVNILKMFTSFLQPTRDLRDRCSRSKGGKMAAPLKCWILRKSFWDVPRVALSTRSQWLGSDKPITMVSVKQDTIQGKIFLGKHS